MRTLQQAERGACRESRLARGSGARDTNSTLEAAGQTSKLPAHSSRELKTPNSTRDRERLPRLWSGLLGRNSLLHDLFPAEGNSRIEKVAMPDAKRIETFGNHVLNVRIVLCGSLRKDVRLAGIVPGRIVIGRENFERFGQVFLLVEHDANLLEILGVLP